MSDEFKTLREEFKPASDEEGKAAIREAPSSSSEDKTGGEEEKILVTIRTTKPKAEDQKLIGTRF